MRLNRIRLAVVAAGLVLLWLIFARTMTLLIILVVIVGAVWGWWEIRELRKAMRTPPKG